MCWGLWGWLLGWLEVTLTGCTSVLHCVAVDCCSPPSPWPPACPSLPPPHLPPPAGDLVIVFNFHPVNSYTDFRVGCYKPGPYKVILSSDEEVFGGYRNVTKVGGCAAEQSR